MRASNGVVWAASPSYDCRPINVRFLSVAITRSSAANTLRSGVEGARVKLSPAAGAPLM